MLWTLGKSHHFSEPQFISFVKWGESVRALIILSSPLGLDIHQRWVLVWLACLLFAAALFLLFLLKKDHVKGERFLAPHSPGVAWEFAKRRRRLSSPAASAPLPKQGG